MVEITVAHQPQVVRVLFRRLRVYMIRGLGQVSNAGCFGDRSRFGKSGQRISTNSIQGTILISLYITPCIISDQGQGRQCCQYDRYRKHSCDHCAHLRSFLDAGRYPSLKTLITSRYCNPGTSHASELRDFSRRHHFYFTQRDSQATGRRWLD